MYSIRLGKFAICVPLSLLTPWFLLVHTISMLNSCRYTCGGGCLSFISLYFMYSEINHTSLKCLYLSCEFNLSSLGSMSLSLLAIFYKVTVFDIYILSIIFLLVTICMIHIFPSFYFEVFFRKRLFLIRSDTLSFSWSIYLHLM